MDATLKAKWVEALRSGEYTQARNIIGDADEKFLCCLGVGAMVACPGAKLQVTRDAIRILQDHGLEGDELNGAPSDLIDLNDGLQKSFAEIADYIEQNL